MAMTEYQKKWEKERREQGIASKNVSIKLTQADLKQWEAYTQYTGYTKTTSMVRACVARCMALDGCIDKD